MKTDKQRWTEDTALFYFQIFSGDYSEEFLNKLLSGGGGNSTLCASWYKLSPRFVAQRVSKTAVEVLKQKSFTVKIENNIVILNGKEIKNKSKMFYNNAKGADKRKKAGKFFHFDHNPSNKRILFLLYKKIREYLDSNINTDEILKCLTEYLKTIQTVDLITVEQDDIRTNTDRSKGPLTSKERDDLLNDEWFELQINY